MEPATALTSRPDARAQPETATATATSAPARAQGTQRERSAYWRRKNEHAQLAEAGTDGEAPPAIATQHTQGRAATGGRGPRPPHKHGQPPRVEKVAVVIRGADGRAYRRSVQCFFVNEHGNVLLFTPIGPCNASFRQTVQGGADVRESPQETARRETWEETGLQLDTCATFIGEVLPSNEIATTAALAPMTETRNDKDEIACERRQVFRYRSKTWVKQGIFGQELYPLLYFLSSEAIEAVQLFASGRGCRTEFNAVEWGPLRDAMDRAPPSKKAVMSAICPAVAAAARPYLEARGIALDGLQGLLGGDKAAEAAPPAA